MRSEETRSPHTTTDHGRRSFLKRSAAATAGAARDCAKAAEGTELVAMGELFEDRLFHRPGLGLRR